MPNHVVTAKQNHVPKPSHVVTAKPNQVSMPNHVVPAKPGLYAVKPNPRLYGKPRHREKITSSQQYMQKHVGLQQNHVCAK